MRKPNQPQSVQLDDEVLEPLRKYADSYWSIGWQEVAANPWGETQNSRTQPVLFALAETAQYDIWDTSVMLQVIYTKALEWHVRLLPFAWTADEKKQAMPDWKIEVAVPPPPDQRATIATFGAPKLLDVHSPKAMLGKAVLVASQQMYYSSRGNPSDSINRVGEWRVVIRVGEQQMGKRGRGYWVFYKALTGKPGAHCSVDLSEDMTEYRRM